MDYIKSSLGYGSQSGQEPISGETGKGTPDQPYDAGNVAGIVPSRNIRSRQRADLMGKVNLELQQLRLQVPTLLELLNMILE